MLVGSWSYILLKAAFTAVVATGFWYAWARVRKFPNAEKSALTYGALMFVVLSIAFGIFEWVIS